MRLSARIATLELAETFVISRSAQDTADVVFVELEHDGVTGYGEATPIAHYGQSAESALAYLEAQADALGDDPWALEEIESRLPSEEPAARAAIDAALHDLQGKLSGPARLAAPRPAPRRSADLVDDLARRPGRHGPADRGRGGQVQAAEAEARRARRARRRARARGARRHRGAADGRRERGLVAGRGARGAGPARGARRRVLRAAASGRRPRRAGAEGALAAPDLRRRGLPRRPPTSRPARSGRTA